MKPPITLAALDYGIKYINASPQCSLQKELIAYLQRLRDESRLSQLESAKSISFRFPAPGLIEINEKIFPKPKLKGLNYAWNIMRCGVEVVGNKNAVDFYPGSACPGQALRHSITRAAKWVEDHTKCYVLGSEIRRIKFSDATGAITYTPSGFIFILK